MKIKVIELFAGVGGFRIGFERASSNFETIWANQWEPGKKSQHAFDCYVSNFGASDNYVCEDIAKAKLGAPEHDLLCGGFPCQDYSVARTGAQGIEGKKGVLWWEIRDLVEAKKPKVIYLENVDRLLKSPSKQRGRDFGIILKCLDMLGYCVEWRVINAADYGHPQKRRRTFIIAYKKDSQFAQDLITLENKVKITSECILAKAFPVNEHIEKENIFSVAEYQDLAEFSDKFKANFENSGTMSNGTVYTCKVIAKYNGHRTTLREILDKNVDEKYYVEGEKLEKWKYLKGAKKELRYKPNGEPYYYTEGPIPFPDNLDSPARTMLTSESSINRSSHIILDPQTNRYRILTPEECEKINEFPEGWTNTGMPHKFRYFVMGNALVCGLIESVAKVINKEYNRLAAKLNK